MNHILAILKAAVRWIEAREARKNPPPDRMDRLTDELLCHACNGNQAGMDRAIDRMLEPDWS